MEKQGITLGILLRFFRALQQQLQCLVLTLEQHNKATDDRREKGR